MKILERRPWRLLRVAVPLLLVTLAAGACGGGGGGGGPTAPPPPAKGFVFTPGAGTTGITLAQGAATTTTTFVLEVRATSVTDLYGVAFSLGYPNSALRFTGATAGTFLSGASLQVAESPAGTVVVGLSKLGTAAGASGSGVLVTLQFDAIATGQGAFSFSRNTAINSSAATLSDLSWSAGTISVTF
jgi:hypothetical protein